ncbi:MAG: CoA pyrophosphatase [Chloroflexi bacterium]|nr:CoA pyrophosphatase [Chloroflexota bacterium]
MTELMDRTAQFVRTALAKRTPDLLQDPNLKDSAVVLLLYPKGGDHCVLFNKRSMEVEYNKGEFCFPGGSKDPEDADLVATALREVHEEMGIHPKDITLLGELSETNTAAGFRIHPYVGTIPYPYAFKPSSIEIAQVVEVPINHLIDKRNYTQEWRMRLGVNTLMTTYSYNEHRIFGATARILRNFLDILEQSGWPQGGLSR